MKKILSFTLAVVLALSLLVGSAFASSGVTLVAPDTFVSWGSFGDLTSLAVPSVGVLGGHKYIIYQVRDWVVSYFRVRFVIDSFSGDDPIEGETLSWTRYTGAWGLGVNAALEPASYEVEYHAAEQYTYSQNFLHLPVKSNFDYYDAGGELIISGSDRGAGFDSLMDLTLNDGTVIQVPRLLVGNEFIVARSASVSSQYKIWNFGTPDTLDGIYEGAEGVSYSTSEGSFGSGSVTVGGVSFPDVGSLVDLSVYPYLFIGYSIANTSWKVLFSSEPFYVYNQNATSFRLTSSISNPSCWSLFDSSSNTYSSLQYSVSNVAYRLNDGFGSNYDLKNADGNLLYSASFSLGNGSWSWSDWLTMSTALDITQYGDIVYQTFDYPLSNPDDEPSESPAPDTGTPDASNNGLFSWLRTQWVFLLEKLQNIVDAIQNLTFDLDPFPDQTKPILDDFFEHIFPNRVSSDDVSGIGSVLDKMGDWFDTGHGLSDLFGVFDDEGFDSWFSNETQGALDSVGSGE